MKSSTLISCVFCFMVFGRETLQYRSRPRPVDVISFKEGKTSILLILNSNIWKELFDNCCISVNNITIDIICRFHVWRQTISKDCRWAWSSAIFDSMASTPFMGKSAFYLWGYSYQPTTRYDSSALYADWRCSCRGTLSAKCFRWDKSWNMPIQKSSFI